MTHSNLQTIQSRIRVVPDFPKPGISFQDMLPLLSSPEGVQLCTGELARAASCLDFDIVVGIEARGFIFGAPLAMHMQKGFLPMRKPGKLAGPTAKRSYSLEYGSDSIEVQQGVVDKGARVLVVDDVLATGGTASAATGLAKDIGCEVVGALFVAEIAALQGRAALDVETYALLSL